MKAMTKKELAAAAGVTVRTLSRWMKQIEPDLLRLGYDKEKVLLPPRIAEYICQYFGIEAK